MTTPSSPYASALSRLLSSPTLPKMGLLRMRALMHALGDPQRRPRVVHIAGTKGKGSTAAMTASILRAAGLRVGLTTSPHLLSARERIVVDGEFISEASFVDLEARVAAAALTLDASLETPSFFERTIAMAFCAFEGVDVAVVEVGLGGRLDATNVVEPVACGITRLGLDHQEFLGDTLALIAGEKAGILKAGAAAFTVAQEPEAMQVLRDVAARVGVDLVEVSTVDEFAVSLFGAHQRDNAALAVALARAAASVDDEAVARGLQNVSWPGRYERVDGGRVILDGAHNDDSARALRAALDVDASLAGRPRHLVLGMSRGHELRSFVDLLVPGATSIIATRALHARAVASTDVARAAARFGVVDVIDDVASAVEVARGRAINDGGVVVVAGSLFVVGEARAEFVDMPRDTQRPTY